MSNPAATRSDADRDEELARVLDELTRQLRAAGAADIDTACRQHPDLAKELRELWAAAQVAEELGRPSLHKRSTIDMPLADRAAAADLPAPTALPRSFGDYQLLQEIGRGGMGVVYKARQKSLNRTVALKMILRGELASAADLARFRAEAESAARLEHPNIIPVYEVGAMDGHPYFSMKYVEGKTLAQLVAEGPLPSRAAARL